MKKFFLIISIFCLASSFLFGQTSDKKEDADVTIEFETEAGCFIGKILENVWNTRVTYNENDTITLTPTTLLSMLDWQLMNAFYAGYKVNMEVYKKVVFTFNLFTTFSGEYGVMEDFDWKITSEPDHLTNYSNHTLLLDEFYQIEFLAGHAFRFGRAENYILIPKLGIKIQSLGFYGQGGFSLYEDHNWEVESFGEGNVISYDQFFFSPVLFIENRFKLFGFMNINLDLGATWIHSMEARDHHFERSYFFVDKIQDAWLLQAKLAVLFKLGKNHKLGIKGGIQYIPDAYGLSYNSNTSFEDIDYTPGFNDLGGTARLLFNYALVYQLNF